MKDLLLTIYFSIFKSRKLVKQYQFGIMDIIENEELPVSVSSCLIYLLALDKTSPLDKSYRIAALRKFDTIVKAEKLARKYEFNEKMH